MAIHKFTAAKLHAGSRAGVRRRRPIGFIGFMASDPERRFHGTIVAIFQDYATAYKWGSWDQEYIPPTGRVRDQRFYLVRTPQGASLLIGALDIQAVP